MFELHLKVLSFHNHIYKPINRNKLKIKLLRIKINIK